MSEPREISRLYRLLLLLVPAQFRERHGESMEQAFMTLRRRVGARKLAVTLLYVAEAWDLLQTSVRLRVRAFRLAREPGFAGSGSLRRASLFTVLRDDMRIALRSATRHRTFFGFATVTFALGIGATVATYSALESVVLEPLPFPGSNRVVLVWRTFSAVSFSPDAEQVEALQSSRELFEDVAQWSSDHVVLKAEGQALEMAAVKMGRALPAFMGLQPVLGRLPTDQESKGDGERVLLLSHALWRGQFAGARDVLGRTVTINGEPWTIIGVMPPGAVHPNGAPQRVDFWLPLEDRSAYPQIVARLRPGVTMGAASARVDTLFRSLSSNDGVGGKVMAAKAMRAGALTEPLRVLMVAVTLLLMIACVNVANLLLHRAAGRQRETAVLAALGASRLRLVRQGLLETLLLALAGSAMGLVLAGAAIRGALALRPTQLSALQNIQLDGSVLVFSLVVSVLAGVWFGLFPALRAARTDAAASLGHMPRAGASASARARWMLVSVEVALSFALLVGAALLIASLREYAARDAGYEAAHLFDVHVRLPSWRYQEEPARRAKFEQLTEALRRLPAVQGVALAGGSPPESGVYFGQVHVEGKTGNAETTMFHGMTISSDYLGVVRQALLAGRTFDSGDSRPGANSVILGETSARMLFPEGDPIGRRFGFGDVSQHTVVGIVRDAALSGLAMGTAIPIAYWPMTEVDQEMHLLVRDSSGDRSTASELRRIALAAEPDALVEVARVEDQLGLTLSRERFTTSLLTAFAVIALVLASVGLYSVLSQAVTARTHEIGVRVSLGADTASIRRMVLHWGSTALLTGLVSGGMLVAVTLQLVQSHVFGLTQHRPSAWLIAASVLSGVAFLSMWRPMERAARIDPVAAMRTE